ncbi:MAG TPA: tetratricopeptide repeat protein, partial [Propylenella sp.]|nr:tetratricopeptide repeat protein [Propylenella sp.]
MNLAHLALTTIALAVFGQPAFAQSDPVAECDRLAGDARDPQKAGPGVYLDDLQPEPAIAACGAAVAAEPGNARLRYQLGRALRKAGDYEAAAKELEAAAMRGYASAQAALGELYEQGQGVPQDQASALAWFRLAAQQGHVDGEWKLGIAYGSGLGVEQDFAQSAEWLRRAAEHGDRWAATIMGDYYREGKGVEKDEVAAAEWYIKGAELGEEGARHWLGLFFQEGRGGLTKNLPEAAKLFQLAADQGHAIAQVDLAYAYLIGAGVEQDLDKAYEWYRRAADQGNSAGQYNVGVMHEQGKSVAKDEAEAARWYAMAAEQGNADAQNNLGVLYWEGRGVPQDLAKARELFEKAAAAGHERAKNNLAALDRPQPNECDRLAGDPTDPQRVGEGVARIEPDAAAAALSACEAAIAEKPEEGRFHYQLGRALTAQANDTGALQAYEAAARLNHQFGLIAAGYQYQAGAGVAA